MTVSAECGSDDVCDSALVLSSNSTVFRLVISIQYMCTVEPPITEDPQERQRFYKKQNGWPQFVRPQFVLCSEVPLYMHVFMGMYMYNVYIHVYMGHWVYLWLVYLSHYIICFYINIISDILLDLYN